MNKLLTVVDLGRTSYSYAWDLQKIAYKLRAQSKIPDFLLLNEHSHVYTIGKSGNENHLLANDAELRKDNIELYSIDRGGDITYHGPGQLVGYPILDLNYYYLDIHRYLRDIEEVLIRTLSEYGIKARRDKEFTGAWVGHDKIAAIGVKVSRWITMHGFALNIAPDLRYFDRIIPCGIFDRGVTSMKNILPETPAFGSVIEVVVRNFSEIFDCTVINLAKEEFIHNLNTLIGEKVEYL